MKRGEVARAVKEQLESWPLVRWGLSKGLINYSELARMIIEKLGEKASFNSVIVAVRRYAERLEKEEKDRQKELIKLIAEPTLSVRDGVIDAALVRNDKTFEVVLELSRKIKIEKGDLLYVVTGEGEITVIIDEKNGAVLKKLLNKKDILAWMNNLSVVKLKFHSEEFVTTPGIAAAWFNALAEKGINQIDYGTSLYECYFIVKQEDASQAYKTFSQIIQKAKKQS